MDETMVGDGKRGIGRIGAVGARQGVVAADTMTYKDGKPGGFDPHARIPDMDADGIDAAFLYPSLGLFSGAIHDPELAAAVCRAYNRWLADYCKPYPDRLFGVAMLPLQSVELAIDEMRFRQKRAGLPRRLHPAQPVQRQDDPRTAITSRSGRRRRISILRSAFTKAAAAACRRSASTASMAAAPATSSATRWR